MQAFPSFPSSRINRPCIRRYWNMSIDVIEWPRQRKGRAGTEAGTNTPHEDRGGIYYSPGSKGSWRGSIVGKRPRDRNVGFTLTIRFFASVQEHRPVHTRRRRHRRRRRRRRRFSSSSPRDRTAHSELIRGIINAGD